MNVSKLAILALVCLALIEMVSGNWCPTIVLSHFIVFANRDIVHPLSGAPLFFGRGLGGFGGGFGGNFFQRLLFLQGLNLGGRLLGKRSVDSNPIVPNDASNLWAGRQIVRVHFTPGRTFKKKCYETLKSYTHFVITSFFNWNENHLCHILYFFSFNWFPTPPLHFNLNCGRYCKLGAITVK